jgi:hypothetical protein
MFPAATASDAGSATIVRDRRAAMDRNVIGERAVPDRPTPHPGVWSTGS